jgi:outer membrane immunogenic protein
MKRILIASAAFASLFAATTASAADLPVYPKAAPVAVYDWTGFYLGTNVGYSFGSGATSGSYTAYNRVTTYSNFTNAVTNDVITPLPGGVLSGSTNMNGFVGGGQFGYNWQFGNWLAGLEADVQASGERGRVNVCSVAGCPAGSSQFVSDYSLNWFGTARGRLGFLATERLLLYATGGLAYGGFGGGSPNVAYSLASLKAGWTVGAGVEAALGSNWSVKFEYLYMDLGNTGNISANNVPFYQSTSTGARGATTVTQNVYSYLFNTKFTDSIVRVGLNYKFGGPGPVAKY